MTDLKYFLSDAANPVESLAASRDLQQEVLNPPAPHQPEGVLLAGAYVHRGQVGYQYPACWGSVPPVKIVRKYYITKR